MLQDVLVIIGVSLVALIGLGLIVARLYTRASKELAFVRTGFGGEKVVKDGGALVLPVFHQLVSVGMNTLRLEVRRADQSALITADRMRVDCSAEFYVRVKPDLQSIGIAAQTLGERTTNPEALKGLVEGKFVDALRAVAAGMRMEELHEQRIKFVQEVKNSVAEDLAQNGLELESVSLTGLDQTSKEYFNPDNAFDAEGLTQLTRHVEEKRKLRNDIERETQIQIEKKNLETEQQSLEVKREGEYARFKQKQEVETRRAQTEAEIKSEQARRRREAEAAEIEAAKEIAVAREAAQRAEQSAQIEKDRDVQIARQEADIATARKSEEESDARAQADARRAEAVKASEQVITVKQVAEAERRKEVQLVAAREDAEEQAISVRVAAEAEKIAAQDKAEAVRIDAQARADAIRLQADADERRLEVESKGQQLLNEARNILSSELISLDMKVALLRELPKIIEQQVKPMERIDGIKIFDVRGLNGGHGRDVDPPGGAGNLADQAVGAALRYRTQAPILDALLKELGLSEELTLSASMLSPETPSRLREAHAGSAQDDAAPASTRAPRPDEGGRSRDESSG